MVKIRFGVGAGAGAHTKNVLDRVHSGSFKKGNLASLRVNMNEEAHERRMQGLRRAWATKKRLDNGEKFMTRKGLNRKRARLRTTVAKELLEIQKIARTHSAEAMQRLAEIVNDRKSMDSVAIAAAAVIFDRAYGKASQTNINANLNADGKPSQIPAQSLDDRIASALKRIDELAGGKAEAPKGKKQPADIRELDRDTDSSTKH